MEIHFGGSEPIYTEVRRTLFEDGHVTMCGLDMRGMPREIISHMDATRLYHLLTIKSENTRITAFFGAGELKHLKMTCFLLAMHI